MATKNSNDVIKMLEDVYAKAPALPANVNETLAMIAPWFALIFGILGVIGGLGMVGWSPLAAMGGFHYGGNIFLSGILTLVASVLLLVAYPGLNKRQYVGWKWSFWSEVASLIGSLLAANIIGGVIGAIIGFYILFQIKSYFK
jgi:hypothetical protein